MKLWFFGDTYNDKKDVWHKQLENEHKYVTCPFDINDFTHRLATTLMDDVIITQSTLTIAVDDWHVVWQWHWRQRIDWFVLVFYAVSAVFQS